MDEPFEITPDRIPEELRDILTEDVLPLLPIVFEQALAMLSPEYIAKMAQAREEGNVALGLDDVMSADADTAEAFTRSVLAMLDQPPEYREDSLLGMKAMKAYQDAGSPQSLDKAIEHFRNIRSLDVFWTDYEQARPTVLTNSATCHLWRYEISGETSDLDSAFRLIDKALEITPEDHPLKAGRLQVRSSIHSRRYERFGTISDLHKAIEDLREGVSSCLDLSPYLPSYLDSLGNELRQLYASEGDLLVLDELLKVYRDAVVKTPEGDPRLPGFLNNLATGYQDLFERRKDRGDFDEALRLFRRSVELASPSSPPFTMYLANLAGALRTEFLYTREPEILDESIRSFRRVVEEAPAQVAALSGYSSGLGGALLTRAALNQCSEDLDEALQVLQSSVESIPENSPRRIVALNNLAQGLAMSYDMQGNREALHRLREVSESACKMSLFSSADLQEGLRCARSWGNWEFEGGFWNEAARAYEYAERITSRLLKVQLFRQGKELWLHEAQGVPGRAAYALAKAGDLQNAVATLERGRARLLTEALDRDHADLEFLKGSARADLYDRYASVTERWNVLVERLAYLSRSQDTDLTEEAKVLEVLREAHTDLNAAAGDIRSVQGYELFQLPSSFKEVQEVADQTPLVYLITTVAGSLALTVTKSSVHADWFDVTEQELEGLFTKTGPEGGPDGEPHMFPLIGGYVYAQVSDPDHLEEALDEILPILGERLMSGLARRLDDVGSREVILVPNGQLGSVPSHAAVYKQNGRTVCFIDEFDVSYVPNARSLGNARKSLLRRRGTPSLAGVGNPLPTSEPSLESARSELEAITGLFGEACSTFYEYEAVKASVVESMERATHLHFACHGGFSVEHPPGSGLLLSHDEELKLEELLYGHVKMPRARLAVLSACQTAITAFYGLPDEYIGLPVGFLQSGIPGVVGTLWPVNDCVTALLMVKFYELHLQGNSETREELPLSQALCEAQRWLRRVDAEGLSHFIGEHPVLRSALNKALRNETENTLYRVLREPAPAATGPPLFADSPVLWAPFVFVGT